MTDFAEFETETGKVMVNVDRVECVLAQDNGLEAVICMIDGDKYFVKDTYENVSNFIFWVADGRPDLDHDENCPDCGGPLEDMPDDSDKKTKLD